jgi:hypothetical protein
MVSSVAAKVLRLEEATGGGGWDGPPCDECGWGGGEEPFENHHGDTYEIVFDERLYDEPAEEETCSSCGRVLSMTIFFDDDVRAPWNQARLPSSARGRSR